MPEKSPLTVRPDKVVISGIGGRYPESDSLDEFRDNLYNNVDMISGDDRRWPVETYGMSSRMGKLKQLNRFDASFFGVLPKVADECDPAGRILLETTWESIIDAGINPQTLRGSNTGVYVGYTSVAMPDGVPAEVQRDVPGSKVESLLWFQGSSKAFYANRVSFVFDFHGPSMSIDVACASSMVCLDIAVTDIRLGKCDQAIVAGVAVNLNPFTNHIYQSNNIGSPDGRSKVWDEDANGYVRGETICSLFLQKSNDARRIYATILHTKTNIDGYKGAGMFFPSTESQLSLMRSTYTEAGVNPHDVNYFEGHGTGTKAGDPQEARAIAAAYCTDRKTKLPVGLLKSNIGHGEGASGVASLSKLAIVFENARIPANLNMNKLKSDLVEIVPPLDPVTENRDHVPGISGVNSFGIGGVNAHALLAPNPKVKVTASQDPIPRLVNLNGRTQESIELVFEFIKSQPSKATNDFFALLSETVNSEPALYTSGFPYRGSMLIKNAGAKDAEYQTKIQKLSNSSRRPIVFFFSGMGSQWSAMAKALMPIELFASTIEKCSKILTKVNIDLKYILLSEDSAALEEKIHHFVAITSMQIALIELLKALGLQPDHIIGHSFGEIACAYSDGCLTLEQAVLVSYWRGKAIKDANVPHGAMAAVGLTWQETKRRAPRGVYTACHNSIDSVTVSGEAEQIENFITTLSSEKVFAKEVACANIPFHCPLLEPAAGKMTSVLQKLVPLPKRRSGKWISTSVPENEWNTDRARTASAEYFVNNLLSPVLFHDGCKRLPKDSIIIELAPHALFSAIFKRALPETVYVGLMKRNNNAGNLDLFLNALGSLYQNGVNLSLSPLYSPVQWPVARGTQSIGSLMRWDHSRQYFVKTYPDFHCRATASDYVQKISLSNPDDQYLKDHAFDGRCVLPASAYLLMAWRRFASSYGRLWYQLPVEFENVQFKRATPLATDGSEVTLRVRVLDPTGQFVVLENNQVVVSGRISTLNSAFNYQELVGSKCQNAEWKGHKLNTAEFYTELLVRGFDYGPNFNSVESVQYDGLDKAHASVRWQKNWITFVEGLIQLYLTSGTERGIYVTQSIASFKCDPTRMFAADSTSFPAYVDAKRRLIASQQLEIKGLQFANVPLKNVMKDVKMEKYQFVPYDEDAAIEKCDLEELKAYSEACDTLADSIQQAASGQGVNGNLRRVCEAMSIQARADQTLLATLQTLHSQFYDDNMNQTRNDPLKASDILQVLAEKQLNLADDMLATPTKNGRLMRASLDVVNENGLRNVNIIEANYCNTTIGSDLVREMGYFFHYPLVADYNLVCQDVKQLPESVRSSYQTSNWPTLNYSSLPEFEAPADLLVFKDSPTDLRTLNIKEYCQSISENVKELGFVFVMMRTRLSRAEKFIAEVLGFEQESFSEKKLKSRCEAFKNCLIQNGFRLVSSKNDSVSNVCMLLRKTQTDIAADKQAIVQVQFGRFDEWVDKLKSAFTEFKNLPKNQNVWMISDDSSLNGVLGLINCLRQEPGGDRFRCIYSDTKLPRPIDFNSEFYKQILEKDLTMNVLQGSREGSYRMLNLQRDYNQVPVAPESTAFMDVNTKGDLSSATWILDDPKNDQVPVEVYFTGLEARDQKLATGALGSDYLHRNIASEFVGRCPQGRSVFGINSGKALANRVFVDRKQLIDIPSLWSAEEAITLLGPLFNAWYWLVEKAQIKQNETVLIVAGSGVQAQAALQLCATLKCQPIIGVSGDKDLSLPLGEIVNIDNDTFVDRIMELTNGSGVNCVLDVATPGSTFSTRGMNITSSGGRYIQVDYYNNVPTLVLGQNTTHYMISTLYSDETIQKFMPEFGRFVQANLSQLTPVDSLKIFLPSALNHALAEAASKESTSKVLISLENCKNIRAVKRSRFSRNKTYILVGGLGGLGLEVAYWMAERGARKLVLVSRSGIKTEYQYMFVRRIAEATDDSNDKCHVAVSTNDSSSPAGAERLIREAAKLGPVGGIFHFATVLADAFIEDQTAAAFKKVCAPKMDALQHIDAATRKLCPELDYFVAFSSQSSGRGFVGQNNYGYANSVMEHVCEVRRLDGLPGQAIEYGPIGDVGLWASNDHVDLSAIGMVINTQRIPSCMEVLDRFLSLGNAIVSTIVRQDLKSSGASSGNASKNHIWQSIGIDIESLSDSLTLSQVGMESILAVEMQQRIEREYGVNLSTEQIKQLTVAQIKQYRTDDKSTIKSKIEAIKSSK